MCDKASQEQRRISPGKVCRVVVQRIGVEQLLPLCLWRQRPELLRKLLQRAGLRHDVAAFSCGGGLGPVHERRLDVVSRGGICLGLRLPLGLDAISLRILDLRQFLWLVLAAGKDLDGLEHWPSRREPSAAL